MHVIIMVYLMAQIFTINIRMNSKDERRCFMIRSAMAKTHVNFSYVVFSEIYKGNNIEFILINNETNELISHSEPTEDSHQRIFRFLSDGQSNYKACFISPNDYPKNIRIYIEYSKREDLANRDNIYTPLKLLNDLKEEERKLEEAIFLEYMKLKNVSETIGKSQKIIFAAFVLKFALFSFSLVVQFYGVLGLFSKMNVRFSEIV